MEFEVICRTCLGSKTLNPIFKNKEYHERFSTAIMNTTGLKVELDDGLPQNICIDCMAHINSSLKFRAKCKDSETRLFEMCQLETHTFKDDKETILNEIQENILESDDSHIKMEIDLPDKKPMSYLKQDCLNLEGSSEITTDNMKSENITILENKLIDIKKYKTYSTNKNKKENKLKYKNEDTTTNNLKVENNEFFAEMDTNDTLLNEVKTEEVSLDLQVVKKRVICRICKKSLSVRSVDAHMSKRHPGSDERKIKCELCDEYVIKMKLTRHLSMMHGNMCTKCGYCKMEFSTKETLIKHVASCSYKKRRRKHDKGKEMSECEVCHKKMQRASLRMHQKILHAGLGPVCDHCGRKFGNKLRLQEHMRARHGLAKHECAICGFRSAARLAMRNHERRHRGDKPYVCETCGARFHAAYLLTQHRQSHRTDKPAKCDLCPATFKANNSLHMHKAACHSNTTYKCTLCERAYSCKNYVLRHLRSVHGYSGPTPEFDLKSAISVVSSEILQINN